MKYMQLRRTKTYYSAECLRQAVLLYQQFIFYAVSGMRIPLRHFPFKIPKHSGVHDCY